MCRCHLWQHTNEKFGELSQCSVEILPQGLSPPGGPQEVLLHFQQSSDKEHKQIYTNIFKILEDTVWQDRDKDCAQQSFQDNYLLLQRIQDR